ncbi:MAG: hypothetical protein WDW38_010246 [Sanguina aurantia]
MPAPASSRVSPTAATSAADGAIWATTGVSSPAADAAADAAAAARKSADLKLAWVMRWHVPASAPRLPSATLTIM